jgi:hypothetical protein
VGLYVPRLIAINKGLAHFSPPALKRLFRRRLAVFCKKEGKTKATKWFFVKGIFCA